MFYESFFKYIGKVDLKNTYLTYLSIFLYLFDLEWHVSIIYVMSILSLYSLSQLVFDECWQNECRLMHIAIVVTKFHRFFLFRREGHLWDIKLDILIQGAYHKTYLSRRVGGDGRVSVGSHRELIPAVLESTGDYVEVVPDGACL